VNSDIESKNLINKKLKQREENINKASTSINKFKNTDKENFIAGKESQDFFALSKDHAKEKAKNDFSNLEKVQDGYLRKPNQNSKLLGYYQNREK